VVMGVVVEPTDIVDRWFGWRWPAITVGALVLNVGVVASVLTLPPIVAGPEKIRLGPLATTFWFTTVGPLKVAWVPVPVESPPPMVAPLLNSSVALAPVVMFPAIGPPPSSTKVVPSFASTSLTP